MHDHRRAAETPTSPSLNFLTRWESFGPRHFTRHAPFPPFLAPRFLLHLPMHAFFFPFSLGTFPRSSFPRSLCPHSPPLTPSHAFFLFLFPFSFLLSPVFSLVHFLAPHFLAPFLLTLLTLHLPLHSFFFLFPFLLSPVFSLAHFLFPLVLAPLLLLHLSKHSFFFPFFLLLSPMFSLPLSLLPLSSYTHGLFSLSFRPLLTIVCVLAAFSHLCFPLHALSLSFPLSFVFYSLLFLLS